MSQNEGDLNMSNFNVGDVVRIGKGKVEYVVSQADTAVSNDLGTYHVTIESMNTGKAQVIEAGRLTLLRAAETEPMNVPQNVTVELVEEETGEAFDPREDRRQSAYGLQILNALVMKSLKNGRGLAPSSNPLKPIGSKRVKVRKRIKALRTQWRNANEEYNVMRRAHGYRVQGA